MNAIFLEVAAAFPAQGEVVLLMGDTRPISGYFDECWEWTHDAESAVAGAVDLDDGACGVFLMESFVIDVLH